MVGDNDSLTASALPMMPKPELVRINLLGRHRICRNPTATFSMRLLLTAGNMLLFLVSTAFGFADFSGEWVLDLRASSSPHAMLQRLGASWVERRFWGSIRMEATYTQTPQLLTVDHRGFGFQKTDVIRIDPGQSWRGRWGIRPLESAR